MTPQDPGSALQDPAKQSGLNDIQRAAYGAPAAQPGAARAPAWLRRTAGAAVEAQPQGVVAPVSKFATDWEDLTDKGIHSVMARVAANPAATVQDFVKSYRALPQEMQQAKADFYQRQLETLRGVSRQTQIANQIAPTDVSWVTGIGESFNFFGIAAGLADKMEAVAGGTFDGTFEDVDETGGTVKSAFKNGLMTRKEALQEAAAVSHIYKQVGVDFAPGNLMQHLSNLGNVAAAAGAARGIGEIVGTGKLLGMAGKAIAGTAPGMVRTALSVPFKYLGGGLGNGAMRATGPMVGHGLVARELEGIKGYYDGAKGRLNGLVRRPGESLQDAEARVNNAGDALAAGAAKAFTLGGIVKDFGTGLTFWGIGKVTHGIAAKIPGVGINLAVRGALEKEAAAAFKVAGGGTALSASIAKRAGSWLGQRGVSAISTGLEYAIGTFAVESAAHALTGQGTAPWEKDELGNDAWKRTLIQGLVGAAMGATFESPLSRIKAESTRPPKTGDPTARLDWIRNQLGPQGREALALIEKQAPSPAEAADVFEPIFDAVTKKERVKAVQEFGKKVAQRLPNAEQAKFDAAEGDQWTEPTGQAPVDYVQQTGADAEAARAEVGRADEARWRERSQQMGVDPANETLTPDAVWEQAQVLREAGRPDEAAVLERGVDLLTRDGELTSAEQETLQKALHAAEFAAGDAGLQQATFNAVDAKRRGEDARAALAGVQKAIRQAIIAGAPVPEALRGREAELKGLIEGTTKEPVALSGAQRAPLAKRPEPRRMAAPPAKQAQEGLSGLKQAQAGSSEGMRGLPPGREVPQIPNLFRSKEQFLREQDTANQGEEFQRDAEARRRLELGTQSGEPRTQEESLAQRAAAARMGAVAGSPEAAAYNAKREKRATFEYRLAALEKATRDTAERNTVEAASTAEVQQGDAEAATQRRRRAQALQRNPETSSTEPELVPEKLETVVPDLPGAKLVTLNPEGFKKDPARFQMRGRSDAKTGDAGRVGDPYREDLSNPWLVWEAKDGTQYVVDAHNRDASWRRTDPSQRPAEVRVVLVREVDGVTADMARTEALVRNLAGDSLDPVDAAEAMRAARVSTDQDLTQQSMVEYLKARGVAQKYLTHGKVAAASDLMELSPRVFDAVKRGELSVEQGRAFGNLRNRFDAQDAAFEAVLRQVEALGRDLTPAEVLAQVRRQESVEQGTVAVDPYEEAVAGAAAQILDAIRNSEKTAKGLLSRLAKAGQGTLEKGGVRVDKKKLAAAMESAREQLATLDTMGARSSGLSNMLRDAGAKLVADQGAFDSIVASVSERVAAYDPLKDAFADGIDTIPGEAPSRQGAMPGDGTGDLFGDPASTSEKSAAAVAAIPAEDGFSEARAKIDKWVAGQRLPVILSYVEALPTGPLKAHALEYVRALIASGKIKKPKLPKT